MSDKYYVSDANGGKEVDIPVRKDPFDAILKKPEPQNKAESLKSEPQPHLAAGDVVAKEYKDSFVDKEEAVVTEPTKEIIYGHCNNCRLELTEEKVVKTPIDYQRSHDGSLNQIASRFSVFCKQCMKFVCVIDKTADQMLQDMIRKGVK